MELHQVKVVKCEAHTAAQTLLSVEPGLWCQSHEHPGQYLMFKGPGDEKPRPLALASAPGVSPLALLLRAEGEREALLRNLKAGNEVACSAPAGPGYPIGKAAGAPLWLVATGTALAPIKTTLDAMLANDRMPSVTHLFIGARRQSELAFQTDLNRYRAAGVTVEVIYSQPETGTGGHVQALLDKAPETPSETLAFICGQPEMMNDVTAILTGHGLVPDNIFRNF